MIGDRKEDRRTRSISFRLTEDEYKWIEQAASMRGENANDWCRNLAVVQAREGHGFTRNEQLIFGEIARLRYLYGNAMMLTLTQQLNVDTWKEVRDRAEDHLKEAIEFMIRRNDPRDPYATQKKEGTQPDGLPAPKTYSLPEK